MAHCQCGCGGLAPIAKHTVTLYGHVKGQPVRFIAGHNARKDTVKGYRKAYGTKSEKHLHRCLAEQALGKPLPTGAVVHHADGTKSEHSALVICQDEKYHRVLHARLKVQQAGGDPNAHHHCYTCKQLKNFSEFARPKPNQWYCRECIAARVKAVG